MINILILAVIIIAFLLLLYFNRDDYRKTNKVNDVKRTYNFRKYANTDNQSKNIYCKKGIQKDAAFQCSSMMGCKGFTLDTERSRTCYKSDHWPRIVQRDNIDYYQCIFPNANL